MRPDTNDLITAYSLCACPGECSRSCVVCNSPSWAGKCVRQRWNEHAASVEGQRAAQRFNTMVLRQPVEPVDEKSEAAITFIEETLGIGLLPWQAELLRYILNHDGPIRNRR